MKMNEDEILSNTSKYIQKKNQTNHQINKTIILITITIIILINHNIINQLTNLTNNQTN